MKSITGKFAKKQPNVFSTAGDQFKRMMGGGDDDGAVPPKPKAKTPTTLEMRATPRQSILLAQSSPGGSRRGDGRASAAARSRSRSSSWRRRHGCCQTVARALVTAGWLSPTAEDDVALLHSGDIDILTETGFELFLERFELPEEHNPRNLDGAGRQRLLRLFDHFDVDGSRAISHKELRVGLSRLHNAPTDAEAKKMITQLDLSRGGRKNGAVDFEEFCIGLLHRRCDLYLALYAQKRLTGVPVEPEDLAADEEPDATAAAKGAAGLDSRQRLSAVISAYTGREASPLV